MSTDTKFLKCSQYLLNHLTRSLTDEFSEFLSCVHFNLSKSHVLLFELTKKKLIWLMSVRFGDYLLPDWYRFFLKTQMQKLRNQEEGHNEGWWLSRLEGWDGLACGLALPSFLPHHPRQWPAEIQGMQLNCGHLRNLKREKDLSPGCGEGLRTGKYRTVCL